MFYPSGSFDEDVFEDPHTQARDMEVDLDGVRMLGIPVKMSDTPGAIRRTAPEVGEHTAEVLAGGAREGLRVIV